MKADHSPEYFATIDIGSNAIRMVLGQYEEPQLKIIDSWRNFLSLGDDVFQSGQISSKSLKKLTQILEEFTDTLQSYPHPKIFIAGTSAMRDTKNRLHVVEHLKSCLGLELHILSGLQEADYTFKAIQNFIHWKENPVMLADLGGGSLEISVIEQSKVSLQKSFDCGTRRLSKLKVSLQKRTLQTMETGLRTALIDYPNPISRLILTGGNAKVLARLVQSEPIFGYPIRNLITLAWEEFVEMKKIILTHKPEHYVQSQQIRSSQALVLPFALSIFEQLGELAHCEKITLPFVGLKEGMLLEQAQHYYPQCQLLLLSSDETQTRQQI